LAITFDLPSHAQIDHLVMTLLKPHFADAEKWARILAVALKGKSHNDIEREITQVRRSAVTSGISLDEHLKTLVRADDYLSRAERIDLARMLEASGITSQREAQRITGVSRDTIRKPKAAGRGRRREVLA